MGYLHELLALVRQMNDPVNHPRHYRANPSGVECIVVVEHMSFNVGNAMKYLWRADEKGNALEDLKKAAWYVQREIERRRALRPIDPLLDETPVQIIQGITA